jgi:hypothetical protein
MHQHFSGLFMSEEGADVTIRAQAFTALLRFIYWCVLAAWYAVTTRKHARFQHR